jgi:hypothetical protein
MATPDKLKKYQKAKFESYKKVNDLKINDNEAYIEMKIDGFDDIKDDYCLTDGIVLKQEFTDAILKRTNYIPLDYPLVLQIYNKTFTSSEKILVRKLIKNHFTLEMIDKEIELKKLRLKIYFFLSFAILGFLLYLLTYIGFVKTLQELISLVASFITSFSIWEISELIVFEEDEVKEEIIKYKHLSKIRIVFNKDNS